jgi:hypothetical protein
MTAKAMAEAYADWRTVTRLCRKCRSEHAVFYFVTTRRTHLVMICGNQWTYIPFEDGLEIETVYSKSMMEIEARERQLDKECDEARDRDRT